MTCLHLLGLETHRDDTTCISRCHSTSLGAIILTMIEISRGTSNYRTKPSIVSFNTRSASSAVSRLPDMVAYVWIRCFDACLKRAQMLWTWSLEESVAKLWRLHSRFRVTRLAFGSTLPAYRPAVTPIPTATKTLTSTNTLTAARCCCESQECLHYAAQVFIQLLTQQMYSYI